MLERARRSDAIIQQAQREADEVIRALTNSKKKERVDIKEHEIIALKGRLQTDSYYHKETGQASDPDAFKPGQTVKVLNINRTGTLIEKINDQEWLVQMGILNSRVSLDQLQIIPNEANKHKAERTDKTNKVKVVKHSRPRMELDLRGKRYEEAMAELDKFIDTAMLHNLHQVTIIHGHGTGALRKGVQSYLKRNKNIESYRSGGDGEGGLGVTIATFK